MQNIVNKLQDIIRTHYGYQSDFEWRPISSYQSLHRENYSSVDKTLSIPLFEPKSQRAIAFLKVHNVETEHSEQREKLVDLVHLSLQSYINLLDELEISDNLIQYLQVELQPRNIIRLHSVKKSLDFQSLPEHTLLPDPPWIETPDSANLNRYFLIKTALLQNLEKLSLTLHNVSKNDFYLRTDHMQKNFLYSINDLMDLDKTTLFIPSIEELSLTQQKTIETFNKIKPKHENRQILVVAGTNQLLSQITKTDKINPDFLKLFNYIYCMESQAVPEELRLESLHHCARAILDSPASSHMLEESLVEKIKSYLILPTCKDLHHTLH